MFDVMKDLMPRNEIERLIVEVRADGYEMFRTVSKEPTFLYDLEVHFPDIEVNTFRVGGGRRLSAACPCCVWPKSVWPAEPAGEAGGRDRPRPAGTGALVGWMHEVHAAHSRTSVWVAGWSCL